MSNKTAVVIDDEIDLSTYISSILEENDFIVHAANEAESGEALIREKHPDIILLDLMMPGRSGVQLFAKLKRDEATKNIPLIMVTGIKDEMGIDWGEAADQMKTRKPDGFIEKPVDPEKLMRVVNVLLSGADTGGKVIHG